MFWIVLWVKSAHCFLLTGSQYQSFAHDVIKTKKNGFSKVRSFFSNTNTVRFKKRFFVFSNRFSQL